MFLKKSAIVLLLLVVATDGFAAEVPSADIQFSEQVKPLFAKYCYGCHGENKKKADLSLQRFHTEAEALKERATWEKVLHNVQTGEMPPDNKPQPSQAERDLISRWIETKVLQCDCDHPDSGRVTIRRLNRNEYNNTIRDLVGINIHPADDFSSDDTGYGFDNIGDVLSMPPVLLEKYVAAARKILNTAIVAYPNTNGPATRVMGGKCEILAANAPLRTGGVKLTRTGPLRLAFIFPKDGDYLIRINAWGDQCGDEPPKMKLRLDEQTLEVFDVPVRQDEARIFKRRLRVKAGEHELTVSYLNNFVNREDPDPDRRDRNLAIEWIEIVGPAGPQALPESHKRIFAKPVTGKPDKRAWAREIISGFATRAYRRPVRDDEVNRLLKFYEMATADGESFEAGVQLALQAVLVSPHFLFRGELQPEPDNPSKSFPIDEFALASRLSYFLWSTMPDEELFTLAGKNKLRKNLEPQVRRMLRDPKAEAFVQNFVGQWLQLRNLKLVQPDPMEFPEFDEELRAAMEKETELLFFHILREDRSMLEFLDANYTYMNARLAKHYGVSKFPSAKGKGTRGDAPLADGFQKVKVDSSRRGGVLTHASILTLTSNPTRTSPVKRGKFVLENILGTPPPPPPPDVPDLKEEKQEQLKGTLRQRMEQHRADPNCASCHAKMDPIGFGMENFDGIGAWRKKDGDSAVDPSGTLVTGENFSGPAELKKILAEEKKDEFARCLTEKMLTYALGRGLEFYDKCAVDKICNDLSRRDYKFSTLIAGIINSVPFQMRRGEGARVAELNR